MNWSRFFRRVRRNAELAQELRAHLETEIEENIARGMSPESARAAAHRKLGNPTLIREEIYRMDSAPYFEAIWNDIRYAIRTLRKNPAFTIAAILTLALGIGGNTAIFTVIRSVLLKPLDYQDPDRLVMLTLSNPKLNDRNLPFSLLRRQETKKTAQSFSDVGSFLRKPENLTLSGEGAPESLNAARVSGNFLDILGIQPIVGRGFLPDEDRSGGTPVVLLSDGLWKRRFKGDPQITGRSIILDSTVYTIIGVLPAGFAFPFPEMDIWVTKPTETTFVPPRFWNFVTNQIVFARLKPTVNLEQASTEMEVVNRLYLRENADWQDAKPGVIVHIDRMKERIVSNVRPMLWVLFGAVGFVLLIACANLASLVLARASSRSREFAVRAALGAGRGRLIAHLLSESLVLSAAGGVLGVLLAQWSLTALPKITALPRIEEIHVDGAVLGFTIAISIATGVLFGLFPSLEASKPNLASVLRESGAAAGASSWRRRLLGISPRGLLVVGQVALSIVLLIGAALLMQSFARLRNVDPGFQPANLLTMKIPLPGPRYDTKEKRVAFYEELERRVKDIPGVKNVAIMRSLPTTSWFFTNVDVEGQPQVAPREQPSSQLQSITPDYFRTMGTPVRRGRAFTAHDNTPGAPPVLIVNETFARRFWPSYPAGLDPIGQHIVIAVDRVKGEIVGIVADVREGGLGSKAGLEFYIPSVIHAPQVAYLAVRTATDPRTMVNAIRSEVHTIDRDQAVSEVKTMDEVLDATLGQRRLTMLLLGTFAGVALFLALIGIYGVIAYSVAQRTQEVGIRRALGADRRDILRLILNQALGLTLAGVAIGIAGAFAFTRVMKTLLFEIEAVDLPTFTATAVLFVAVALTASLIPAWRAVRIDPMTALRIG